MKPRNTLRTLKAKVQSNPDSLDILLLLAREYEKKQEYKHAIKYLTKILMINSGPTICCLLGDLYLKQKELNAALSYYEQALQLSKITPIENKPLVAIYYNMGDVHQQLTQLYDAFYCYELALQYEPQCQQSHQFSTQIAEQITGLIVNEWFIANTLKQPMAPVTTEIPTEPFRLDLNLPELADSSEEVQLNFCKTFTHELNAALISVDSMPALEAFLTVFSLKQLRPLLDKYPTHFSILGQGWQIAVANTLNNAPFKLTLKLFDIANLLEKFAWKSSSQDHFHTQKEILETTFRNQTLMPIQRTNAAILLFAIDALQNNNSLALTRFIEKSIDFTDRLSLAMLAPLWHYLFTTGWFADNPSLLHKVMDHYAVCFAQLNSCNNFFSRLVVERLLNYSLNSSRDWNQSIFEKLIFPTIQKSLLNNNHALALQFASITDFTYAQQPHTDEQHALCWRAYLEDFLIAGRNIKQEYNLKTIPKAPLNADRVLKVGIVVSLLFNNCSPVRVILQIANSLMKLSPRKLHITIYAYEGVDKKDRFLIEPFKSLDIAVINLIEHRGLSQRDNAVDRILTLRNMMIDNGTDMCIYTQSTLSFVAFSSAIGLTFIHVLWTMGEAYDFRIPEVQGCIVGGLFKEVKYIGGQAWNIFPFRSGENFQISKAPTPIGLAHHIRRGELGQFKTVIGCIGRAQKIDNDEFMDVLATILKSKPDCVFLWFGKEELLSVQEKMQTRGILDQCIFKGWADINVYARVLDIQIDSFPFPLGIATLQCMSAGTPCVHYFSQEPIETITRYVFLALNGQAGTLDERNALKKFFINDVGQSLFLGATSTTEYVDFIQMLIDNVQFRLEVGIAGRNFMNSFMCDDLATAHGFSAVIHDIYNNATA